MSLAFAFLLQLYQKLDRRLTQTENSHRTLLSRLQQLEKRVGSTKWEKERQAQVRRIEQDLERVGRWCEIHLGRLGEVKETVTVDRVDRGYGERGGGMDLESKGAGMVADHALAQSASAYSNAQHAAYLPSTLNAPTKEALKRRPTNGQDHQANAFSSSSDDFEHSPFTNNNANSNGRVGFDPMAPPPSSYSSKRRDRHPPPNVDVDPAAISNSNLASRFSDTTMASSFISSQHNTPAKAKADGFRHQQGRTKHSSPLPPDFPSQSKFSSATSSWVDINANSVAFPRVSAEDLRIHEPEHGYEGEAEVLFDPDYTPTPTPKAKLFSEPESIEPTNHTRGPVRNGNVGPSPEPFSSWYRDGPIRPEGVNTDSEAVEQTNAPSVNGAGMNRQDPMRSFDLARTQTRTRMQGKRFGSLSSVVSAFRIRKTSFPTVRRTNTLDVSRPEEEVKEREKEGNLKKTFTIPLWGLDGPRRRKKSSLGESVKVVQETQRFSRV
ncbi:hypothetical protein BT69DRAFT_1282114 [Atractiella rhizophila]|nr:hypothetical protein BT69DRAFT_1282114 [Atractiella rhizophila]